MRTLIKIAKLSAKNPRLALNKFRTTIRDKWFAQTDYRKGTGAAHPPSTVCLKLTNACNLRCKMCGQPREGHQPGDIKYAPPEYFKQQLPVHQYKKLLDELERYHPNLYLWGGEPFMYRNILELIQYANSLYFTVQVNTNGLQLKALAEQIVLSGLDDLIISIDGPCHVHDSVRGRKGTFERVRQGIRAIQDFKAKQGQTRPLVRIRGTISPYNFDTISDLITIAEDLNADSLSYNWTWFTTRKTGQAYERLMKDVFDTDAPSWRPFESDVILDPERHRKYTGIGHELNTLFSNRSHLPISMSPFLKPEQVQEYYENIYETFGHRTCFAVYVKSYILPNGDVTPCPDFPDYICGNITQESFMSIWNGKRYRKWRTELRQRGLFPACYRCCDLFLSDVKFV